MTQAPFKMLSVYSLLIERGFLVPCPMPMFCDNQVVIFIAKNPTFHDITK